jgi:hypothetical protein
MALQDTVSKSVIFMEALSQEWRSGDPHSGQLALLETIVDLWLRVESGKEGPYRDLEDELVTSFLLANALWNDHHKRSPTERDEAFLVRNPLYKLLQAKHGIEALVSETRLRFHLDG